MIPLFTKDCTDSRGLILIDADASQPLSLRDIKNVSQERRLEKYDAIVLFNDNDPADKAFRKVQDPILLSIIFIGHSNNT